LALVLLILSPAVTLKPRFANPRRSVQALGWLQRGELSEEAPLGYTHHPEVPSSAPYAWDDYRPLIAYLRHETPPETRVANLLRWYPAVTGPAGRLPALPAESSAWFLVVRPEDAPRFAEALARAEPGTRVVWLPGEERPDRLAALEPVIRAHYEPDRTFGAIAVWRRKGMDSEGEPR
jgi:hypothetical protein